MRSTIHCRALRRCILIAAVFPSFLIWFLTSSYAPTRPLISSGGRNTALAVVVNLKICRRQRGLFKKALIWDWFHLNWSIRLCSSWLGLCATNWARAPLFWIGWTGPLHLSWISESDFCATGPSTWNESVYSLHYKDKRVWKLKRVQKGEKTPRFIKWTDSRLQYWPWGRFYFQVNSPCSTSPKQLWE